MPDQYLLAEVPAATEAESKFDSAAAWDADSANHSPVEAGNDAPTPTVSQSADAEPEPSPAEAAPEETPPVEEPARNDQGQFVKKGKGKPRSDPQARVEQATAQTAAAKEEARQAREEAAALKARLAALESRTGASASVAQQAQQGPASVRTAEFPDYNKWSADHPGQDWDIYHRELTRHEAFQIAQQIADQKLQQWQSQQDQQTKVQRFQQRMKDGAAKYPDWSQKIEAANAVIAPQLAAAGMTAFPDSLDRAVFESERPADLLRYLVEHPEQAIQLAVKYKDLPVSAASVLTDLLESRLAPTAADPAPDSAPKPLISAAKPPVNRVGGSASATPVDPEDLDFGPEYIRAENERERKRAAMGRW